MGILSLILYWLKKICQSCVFTAECTKVHPYNVSGNHPTEIIHIENEQVIH